MTGERETMQFIREARRRFDSSLDNFERRWNASVRCQVIPQGEATFPDFITLESCLVIGWLSDLKITLFLSGVRDSQEVMREEQPCGPESRYFFGLS